MGETQGKWVTHQYAGGLHFKYHLQPKAEEDVRVEVWDLSSVAQSCPTL